VTLETSGGFGGQVEHNEVGFAYNMFGEQSCCTVTVESDPLHTPELLYSASGTLGVPAQQPSGLA
jgi:hypothetical protein